MDDGRRGLSVTLRALSRLQKHKRDKIALLDGGNIRVVSLVTLVAPSEDNSPRKFFVGFSLFLSVTSVTSVTMEENQAVVVSRLCTSKRDRRDKLEGWLCRGAITQTDESVLVLNHWPETQKPDRAGLIVQTVTFDRTRTPAAEAVRLANLIFVPV